MGKRTANTRDEHGVWDIGGGGVGFDETVEEALQREIKEEYGANIVKHEFLGFRDVHRIHNGKKNIGWRLILKFSLTEQK